MKSCKHEIFLFTDRYLTKSWMLLRLKLYKRRQSILASPTRWTAHVLTFSCLLPISGMLPSLHCWLTASEFFFQSYFQVLFLLLFYWLMNFLAEKCDPLIYRIIYFLLSCLFFLCRYALEENKRAESCKSWDSAVIGDDSLCLSW